MEMSQREQRALEAVLQRASVDLEFRRQLLNSPRQAICEAFGVTIPSSFRVKFIERDADVDALIVLPDVRGPNDQTTDGDDDDLDCVAGGGDEDPPDPGWSDGIKYP